MQQLAGSYTGDTFELSPDSGSGTLITLEVTPLIAPAVADVLNGSTINFGAVHVGAAASETLDISNTAASGAAALDASVQSVTGAATASGSFTGLAPGAENTSGITAGIDTSTAGTQSGTVALAFVSDGGTLDSTGLPAQDVIVSGTVYNYATAAVSSTSTLLTQTGPDSYLLNFGTIEVGVPLTAVTLAAGNNASSPAEALDGVFSINGANFLNIRFDPFSTLAAGSSLTVGTIVPDVTEMGNFSETVTLTPTDDNGAGFTLAQTPVTVAVEDDVVATDIFTLTGVPATLSTTDTASITPFANANAGDSAGASFDAYVFVRQSGNGILVSPIPGAVSTDGSSFVLNGTAAQIQAALRSLVFQPALQPSGAPR